MRDRWPPRPVVRASSGLSTLETVLGRAGLGPVAGIDEAGRGACAGPMTVAACILPARIPPSLARLDDSKKLTENAREQLYPKILELPVHNLDLELSNSELDLLPLLVQNPPDKDVSFGLVDVHSHELEELATVKERIGRAIEVLPADRLWFDPDCGLKTRTLEEAQKKLEVVVAAVRETRGNRDD